MELPVYLLYGYVGIICSLIIAIILNRTATTAYKQSRDKKLIYVFLFFIVFCLFDAIWGFVGFLFAEKSPIIYKISTYFFHILSALSSVAISMYAVEYLLINKKGKLGIGIYRLIIFAAQLS